MEINSQIVTSRTLQTGKLSNLLQNKTFNHPCISTLVHVDVI